MNIALEPAWPLGGKREARRAARSMTLLLLAAGLTGCATASAPSIQAKPFTGRTVVITGASSGFGRGIALAMGARGANVVLAARRIGPLETAAATIRASGGQALAVATDVSQPAEVAHLAQAATARFGRVDIWINDAGVLAIGRFDQMPAADQARVVDVNLKGVIYGSQEALTRFRRQGFGVLINMGSVESVVPLPYQATYSATKHAILGLDEALNEELRLDGLRSVNVVTIMPWAADTPIWLHAANYTGHEARAPAMDDPDKIVQAVMAAALNPRRRVGVGWKAKSALFANRLAPSLSEDLAANAYQRTVQTAPSGVPVTSGALNAPTAAGTTVDAGLKTRWREEDQAGQHR